jgi:hypothetical protein
MTKEELLSISNMRSKYNSHRAFYSDGSRLAVKEMPCAAHAIASIYIQTQLSSAILMQLVAPNNAVEAGDVIYITGDGCNNPGLS